MPGTYAGAQKALGLQGFGPREQDLAAIHLMKQRGVDPTRDPINAQTIAKLARLSGRVSPRCKVGVITVSLLSL
jgi:hypothetical protein